MDLGHIIRQISLEVNQSWYILDFHRGHIFSAGLIDRISDLRFSGVETNNQKMLFLVIFYTHLIFINKKQVYIPLM